MRTSKAVIILHEKTFLIRILLRMAVIGSTKALLMATKLGKICVVPKIRSMFSKKSHKAGIAMAKMLT